MKLKHLSLFLLLGFSLSAWAQGKNEKSSLPDLPLSEDALAIEGTQPPAPAKPVVKESAPQEPPFTEPADEFGETPAVKTQTANQASAPRIQKNPAHKKNVEMIEHPLAAKGLLRIEKDGSYIYQTEAIAHDQSATFRMGSMQPPKIESADGQTDFKTMYTQSDIPIFMFDYEWQPFTSFGKLGIQAGLGFFTAQGQGRFLDGSPAREKYTFFAFPLSIGGVYRFQYSDKQWFAPYISGGGTYFVLAEMRDDNKGPHGVGTPAAYGAGGFLFNISAFDRETAFALSSEYGISTLWLSAEYRYIKTFNDDVDLSSGMINVGLAVDY